MVQLRQVFRNINLMNILLLAILVVFALRVFMPALYQEVSYLLPQPKKSIGAENEPLLLQQKPPSLSDYIIISEENPFHPDRKIPVEKKAEKPLPKPQFVLYGTLIYDDLKMAYLEDLKSPHSTSGRGKRQVALKLGDSLSGFTLKEIDAGRVVMMRGDAKVIVPMIDPAHAREGQAANVQAEPQQGKKPEAREGGVRRSRRLGSVKTPVRSPRTFVPGK